MELYSYQLRAIDKMKNGCILCGQVGSGKSRTALAYFMGKVCDTQMEINGKGSWGEPKSPRDLYIITTAKKRDDQEWIFECGPLYLGKDPKSSLGGIKVTVDSWNNIKKYKKVFGQFFIFDEQRLTGSGPWVKAFYEIAKKNQWILLSATPGDKWSDYIPVFVANGFYKNKSDFQRKHIIFAQYTTFPKILGYYNEELLIKHRNSILVLMKKNRFIKKNKQVIKANYDKEKYDTIRKSHWNIFDNQPIDTPAEYCFLQRRLINSDYSRLEIINELIILHHKVIIFYNYDFELDLLRMYMDSIGIDFAEWNGHKHQPLPVGNKWAYLVNYMSGSEGWNCITCDTIIFYSASYSYRTMVQASGRIDRVNTPYQELFYYEIYSDSFIDREIRRCLRNKEDFNEKAFYEA